MAIDLQREDTINLAAAAKLIPAKRGGRTHPTTIWRWAKFGYMGVKLEVLRTPSGYVTSVQAVHRFMARLAQLDDVNPGPSRKEIEAAEARRKWARDFWEKRGVKIGGGTPEDAA